MNICISCGKQTKDFAAFPCAGCSEQLIRCVDCRKNKNPYKCKCGIEGP